MNKESFFTQHYIAKLKQIHEAETGEWGVLSPQGMVEHMTNSIGEAWGRIPRTLISPADQVQRFREFALSDKEFKPNTKNVLMSEEPAPLRHATLAEAIREIETEIGNMVHYHRRNPGATFMNPFFGEFNYEEWLHLLHKHAVHHLRQFRIDPSVQA
ncbi:MAG: hypothetical protein JST26_00550 [Bacteroidetes bacterium]|nr:hypothetical protein [Bacteroidota bacterium]